MRQTPISFFMLPIILSPRYNHVIDMEIVKMIAELRSERAAIEDALIVLERLARSQGKRRGRPPAWLALADGPKESSVGEKKRVLSADVRKRMAEAQKKRWAAYRKAQTP
jgi:hypothetical protein